MAVIRFESTISNYCVILQGTISFFSEKIESTRLNNIKGKEKTTEWSETND